ncbi:molybdate ABC transporter substrate-binding protein [Aquimarina aquimarini]|uniref:molybdate ABC transporter substrate-binding protein n=1 Tax=Aquimarina aquimarini TaxID=1191734 RepID=UPI000D561570|nr:molybdate ABC transporter substrate-binding protein [Aquimarina aquimarini]
MKKTIYLFFASLIISASCQQKNDQKLNIAVAANMQFVIKKLSKTFTNQTGIECNLIISSSGKLTAQIKEGAPFDVFLSADMKYPKELFESGKTIKKPKVYGYGKLVLWSMTDSTSPSIDVLTSHKINHIALANPKTAPYGTASIEALKHHKIYHKIKNKLVYGENISQTNQFIISKAAEVGFTSKSVVLSQELNNKGKWAPIEEAHYSPIAQGVVILKHANSKQREAEKFYNFLSSPDAHKILIDSGYSIQDN